MKGRPVTTVRELVSEKILVMARNIFRFLFSGQNSFINSLLDPNLGCVMLIVGPEVYQVFWM